MSADSVGASHTSVYALQLLEYLIKHGSERVVDDARAHVSTIKMLRNFHYIDDKGKDEGINGTYIFLSCSHPLTCRSSQSFQGDCRAA